MCLKVGKGCYKERQRPRIISCTGNTQIWEAKPGEGEGKNSDAEVVSGGGGECVLGKPKNEAVS